MISIFYKIMKKGSTETLMKSRELNPELFAGEDNESLLEEIKYNKYYYNIKFIKYPIIGIDIDKLSEWAKENKYLSDATEKEKLDIKWDGTKKHLIDTFNTSSNRIGHIILKNKLIKWVKNRQKYDSVLLLTNTSPIIPHISFFYKKIRDGEDRNVWLFDDHLKNTKIYNYINII